MVPNFRQLCTSMLRVVCLKALGDESQGSESVSELLLLKASSSELELILG